MIKPGFPVRKYSLVTYGVLFMMGMMNARCQQPVSYHTIRIDDLDIFYREAGPENAPILLLLHGLPSSSRMYQPLLESALSNRYHLIAPDYPGFGHSSWPDHKTFSYTFDRLSQVIEEFTERLQLNRYTLVMQDYGGPVGFRMALAHPEKIQAMIIQNAVSHEEGLSPLWAVRRLFWEDRAAHEAEVRSNLLSLKATRERHVGSSPHPEQINPDTWVDEYYFLNQPSQAEIQLDLFYDYQNNVKAYPSWQKWLRDHRPPLLVVWGRYDPSFTVAGAKAYEKDDPRAEVHILDAGHFALDLQSKAIVDLIEAFLNEQRLD
jgi:pimeloyl-ACP methyl ester carboxylesterase